jgi:hypothetical protein
MTEKATTTTTAAPKQAPAVDPSPHAPPIQFGSQEYVFPKAEASPQEVLDLKPNMAKDATEGPHEQIDPNAYVRMSKPDGSEFLSPLSNVAHYESKGFVKGATVDVPDMVAYQAERAAKAP